MGDGCPAHEKGAAQVDAQYPVPILVGQSVGMIELENSRDVGEHIHAPKFFHAALYYFAGRRRIRDVYAHRHGHAAASLDFGHSFRKPLFGDIRAGDPGAFPGEDLGGCAPDPRCSAGHQHGASLKSISHVLPCPRRIYWFASSSATCGDAAGAGPSCGGRVRKSARSVRFQ